MIFTKHGKTGQTATLYMNQQQAAFLGPVIEQIRQRFAARNLPIPPLNKLLWALVEKGVQGFGLESGVSEEGRPQDPSGSDAAEEV